MMYDAFFASKGLYISHSTQSNLLVLCEDGLQTVSTTETFIDLLIYY